MEKEIRDVHENLVEFWKKKTLLTELTPASVTKSVIVVVIVAETASVIAIVMEAVDVVEVALKIVTEAEG